MKNMVWLQNGVAVCALASAVTLVGPTASANDDLTLYKAVHHDTSPPLREMIREYNQQHRNDVHVGHHVIPLLPGPATQKLPFARDGIKGGSFVPGKVQTTDLLNFDGVDDAHSLC